VSARFTAAEAAEILRDLARGREDGSGVDVWPLYERAEDAMAEVVALAVDRDAQRARADAAEAECARLRAIVEAADELIALDYAAEVESHSETAPGSHAAAQVRAADAYSALVRLRDAWREAQGAAVTAPSWPLAPVRCAAPEPVALCPSQRPRPLPRYDGGPWCGYPRGHGFTAYIEWRDAQPTCAPARGRCGR